MKKILYIFILAAAFLPSCLKAQIENVIIEKYYISDDNDGTDSTGGWVQPGSTSYRIYIDMGLLRNSDPGVGSPINMADGLAIGIPDSASNWVYNGPNGFGTAEDSTIFGSLLPGSSFISNNVFLQNTPGVMGAVKDSNQV